MKRVLVLGAGHSTPTLIQYLLRHASQEFRVFVADKDLRAAKRRVEGYALGDALALDASNTSDLIKQIHQSDVVVNFLAPAFQAPIARLCLDAKRSMVSASYRSPQLWKMNDEAKKEGLSFVSEFGLDPGIDHMSAKQLIDAVHGEGGDIRSFWSYGGGIAEKADTNPLGYVVTWNPRNVVMAGEAGAQYLSKDKVHLVPHGQIFRRTWPVHLPSDPVSLEAYPNRDALGYIDSLGLQSISTMVRATLRYPGFSDTWQVITSLGLANESTQITNLARWSWIDLVEAYLPSGRANIEQRLTDYLRLPPDNEVLDKLNWLGLFEDTPIGELSELAAQAVTPAEALSALLQYKLALPQGGKDRVILHHHIEAIKEGSLHRWTSTLDILGDGTATAMAKTVGIPAALATIDLLRNQFPVTGCPLPVSKEIYQRYLPLLEAEGIIFREETKEVG